MVAFDSDGVVGDMPGRHLQGYHLADVHLEIPFLEGFADELCFLLFARQPVFTAFHQDAAALEQECSEHECY